MNKMKQAFRKTLTKNKRSQHEMMGFILIVLVVVIIGMVFLGFMFMKKSDKQNSVEISNLLEASMYVTTDCVTSYVPEYKNVQRLISDTYKNPNQKCSDGRTLKSVLEETLSDLVKKSLQVNEDGVNKAFKLNIRYVDENRPDEEILSIEEGVYANCSSRLGGWHPIYGDFGAIEINLEVCKGKTLS